MKEDLKRFLKKYVLTVIIFVVVAVMSLAAFYVIRRIVWRFAVKEIQSQFQPYGKERSHFSSGIYHKPSNGFNRQSMSKVFASRMQEMQKANQSQMQDFHSWLELLEEEDKKNKEKEQAMIQGTIEQLQSDMMKTRVGLKKGLDEKINKVLEAQRKNQELDEKRRKEDQESHVRLIQANMTTTQSLLKQEMGKSIEEQFKVMKLAQLQNERFLEEQRKKEREEIARKQLDVFEQKLSSTLSRIENDMGEKFTKLTYEDKEKRRSYKQKLKEKEKSFLLEQTEQFKKELNVARDEMHHVVAQDIESLRTTNEKERANLLNEQKRLAAKQLQLFDEKLSTTVDQMAKKLETRAQTIVLADEINRKAAEERRREKQELLAAEQLELFNKKLAQTQGLMVQKTDQALAAAEIQRQKEIEKAKKNQSVFTQRQLYLFEKELIATKDKMRQKVGQELEVLSLQYKQNNDVAKKAQEVFVTQQLDMFEEKLTSAQERIKQKAERELAIISLEHKQENEKSRAEQGAVLAQQTQQFNEKLLAIKTQMKDRTEQELASISLHHKQESEKMRKEQQVLHKAQLETFNARFLATEGVLKKRAQEMTDKSLALFDIKLAAAQDRIQRQVETKGAKEIEKNISLFNERLAEATNMMRDDFAKNLRNLVALDAQSRKEEQEKMAAKHLETFQKKLVAIQGELKSQVREQVGRLAIENNDQKRQEQIKIEQQIEQRLTAVVGQIEKQAQEKIHEAVREERQLRAKEHEDFSQKRLLMFTQELAKTRSQVKNRLKEKLHEVTVQIERGRQWEKERALFDVQLAAAKDQLKDQTEKQIQALLQKGASQQDEKLQEITERKTELFEAKLSATQSQLREHVDKSFEGLAEKQLKAFDDKLVQVEKKIREEGVPLELFEHKLLSVQKQVKEEAEQRLKEIVAIQKEKNNVDNELFKKEQLVLFDKRLSEIQKQMQHEAREVLDKKISEAQELLKTSLKAEAEVQRKGLDALASSMVRAIEANLSKSHSDMRHGIDIKHEPGSEFKVLVEKLKGASQKDPGRLEALGKKLAEQQKENMAPQKSLGKRGGEITQKEIDALVQQEVRKQLSSLKFKRDPRFTRLKKVVALEKMRRLVRGLMDGDDYENSFGSVAGLY
ncbi:hypothetical protein KKA53_01320 [Candidatus Dependentiae bacterium]|nr:hypothetical protein [Candidatus Dependentiae bacterium]